MLDTRQTAKAMGNTIHVCPRAPEAHTRKDTIIMTSAPRWRPTRFITVSAMRLAQPVAAKAQPTAAPDRVVNR